MRPLLLPGLLTLALGCCAACAGDAGAGAEPRYPEKRRPPAARSASDGEVLGAQGQSVEDTLEASPTNLHPAPGWEGERAPLRKEGADVDCPPDKPGAATTEAAEAERKSKPGCRKPAKRAPGN